MKYTDVVTAIDKKGTKVRAELCQRFFKTGKGQYGEGDIFCGVTLPELRKISKEYKELSLAETTKLLKSKIHEHRIVALFILIIQFNKLSEEDKKKIYLLYLGHTKYINNWDLVDVSAPHIIGGYLYSKSRKDLYVLAKSKSIWERRMAIVATYYFIKRGDLVDVIKISESLLSNTEDLIHKAVGWMLREAGKQNEGVLRKFLDAHYRHMSRTTLRYAIEKYPEEFRQYFLRRR